MSRGKTVELEFKGNKERQLERYGSLEDSPDKPTQGPKFPCL